MISRMVGLYPLRAQPTFPLLRLQGIFQSPLYPIEKSLKEVTLFLFCPIGKLIKKPDLLSC